ncbi:MAG: sarcosine oxidase [Gammaproteobacteria bacterium]|nr:sarcosine oxidase [Gammaproteobacteria bacterium]NIR83403.1 sarcosine oxidase [Gammaproteobacteria bacterium]NIR91325.1 sarcosine oxidase [Gammaproteobacteria bacterium]NIU04565.1 sarcosine oxidase [Gammaproteobacteria bacterium]NIV51607.1 sarcosine oxidase [Gammaproteobacteria bacterium]
MTRPRDFIRRSPIYRRLESAGATFEERGGAGVAASYGRPLEEEVAAARNLALAELSPLPRIGFKGPGTPEWLDAHGVALPAAPNVALRQSDGALAARLSHDEHLVLSDLAARGHTCARLEQAWSVASAPRCFPMPRRDTHFWYLVSGVSAPTMLAKLCAVDLRASRFANDRVAQTSLARMNVAVIRSDLDATPAFHVLGDSSLAEYLWPCLLDAMNEFGGAPVGLRALLTMTSG